MTEVRRYAHTDQLLPRGCFLLVTRFSWEREEPSAMRIKREESQLALLALTLLIFAGGCALFEKRQDPERNVPKTALPSNLPAAHKLEFAVSPGGERLTPKEKGGTPAPPPTVSPPAVSIDPEAQLRIRGVAELDPRVLKELGKQFVHLHTENIGAGKIICPATQPGPDQTITLSAPPPITRFTYFSYANNVTVIVCMEGEKLASVGPRKGYQPPEGEEEAGSEEFAQAVKLAKEDSRLAKVQDLIKDLKPHALLVEPEKGLIFNEPGFGHRVLWVTFSKGEDGDPQFWAIVDLTDKKVLDAGAEPQK